MARVPRTLPRSAVLSLRRAAEGIYGEFSDKIAPGAALIGVVLEQVAESLPRVGRCPCPTAGAVRRSPCRGYGGVPAQGYGRVLPRWTGWANGTAGSLPGARRGSGPRAWRGPCPRCAVRAGTRLPGKHGGDTNQRLEAFGPRHRVDATGVPSHLKCMPELEEATRAWRRELAACRVARCGTAPWWALPDLAESRPQAELVWRAPGCAAASQAPVGRLPEGAGWAATSRRRMGSPLVRGVARKGCTSMKRGIKGPSAGMAGAGD